MSDETRRFSPFDDDDDRTRVSGNHPDDGPRPGDTRPIGGDETVVTPRPGTPPRPDATSVMPPTGARGWDADDGAWAGRAAVRPPRPADDWATSTWDGAPPPVPGDQRKWWLPIVVGIVALILLGALGWGIYLITSSGDDNPGPATSAPATITQAPKTKKPTSTAPTTTPPTTRTTTTEPTDTDVSVPALIGLSRDEAVQALERRGLSVREITRSGDGAPGTVIDSDPAEGQEVPPGTTVTLVIAAEKTTPPTPTTTTPTQ